MTFELVDAIAAEAKRAIRNELGNVVSPLTYATFVQAEDADSNLSWITLADGSDARFVPKGAHVISLSAGDTLMCLKGKNAPLTIVMKLTGDISLATDEPVTPVPPVPFEDWVTSVNTRTGDVTLDKTDVGLGNVDNTSDANKPVSIAQQAALDLKADLASPTFTGTVTTDGLTVNGTLTGVDKTDVGLGNVDNTSDVDKPVSTAQAAADALRVLKTGDTMTGALDFIRATASDAALNTYVSGDSTARWHTAADGKQWWGPGSGGLDTNLYRSAANTLRTDDHLVVIGMLFCNGGIFMATALETTAAFNTKVTGDAQQRMTVRGNGTFLWGDGTGAQDTNLYRVSANILRTDDSLQVGTDLSVSGNANVTGNVSSSGVVKSGVYTTAGRPSAATAGAGGMVYDSTLSIPIWSDGSVWRNALGVAV